MNILHTITWRNIKLGKKRAIVTIIAIILSTALITATFGLITSFQQSLIKDAEKTCGTYHILINGINAENTKYLENNREIASIEKIYNLGYAKVEEIQNEDKPYVYVKAFNMDKAEEYGIQLVAGRLPKNQDEIAIPEHIIENGMVKWELGDTITLQIGERTSEGYPLKQNNPLQEGERIENTQERTYTIVGKIQRLYYDKEAYSAPGYTCITAIPDETPSTWDGMIIFKDIQKTYEQIEGMKENFEKIVPNSEILRYSGVSKNDAIQLMLYSVAGVIAMIIVVTSVFVIRNSFSIMVAEKNKQYGMLASVGATKKQIKRTVLVEGALLGVVGIPLGIVSGMFAVYCLVGIVNYILTNFTGADMQFYFYFPTLPVIAGILLAMITIYFSCLIPAKRAAKIAPIDAIRGVEDIKRTKKKLKSPKWIQALFGIGGTISYKNLKRSKKQYRTTVISLVLSICVFISLSSFTGYVLDLKDSHYAEMGYDMYVYASVIENTREQEKVYEKIANLEGVDNAFIEKRILVDVNASYFSDYMKEQLHDEEIEGSSIPLTTIGDRNYQELCKKLGINRKEKGAIMNAVWYITNGKGKVELQQEYNVKKGDVMEVVVTTKEEETIPLSIPILETTNEAYTETASIHGMVVSERYLKELIGENYQITGAYIQTKDADKVVKQIEALPEKMHIANYYEEEQERKAITWIVNIFLYGFITVITLIGVTNIFNTITTNMLLRSKEFAMLKSIGMTQKEFNRMIRLESLFYGIKSLAIGILLGLGLSYGIYYAFQQGLETSFEWPWSSIIIACLFVGILIFITMTYSLRKINKQNIMETIRKEV